MCERFKEWLREVPKRRLIFMVLIFITVPFLSLLIFMGIFSILTPLIVVEPQKLDVALSPGENITKTISIGAIGTQNITVTLNVTESISEWVYLRNKNKTGKSVEVSIEREKTSYVVVSFRNISSDNPPGEYEGAIVIMHNKEVKAKIPVFIKIHKAIVQIEEIEAPLKVNESEHFKITAKIKNIGDYDALKVNVSANSTDSTRLKLAERESRYEEIAIIPKNEKGSADWWFVANQTTGWSTIEVNLSAKNADNDTEIIAVEIV